MTMTHVPLGSLTYGKNIDSRGKRAETDIDKLANSIAQLGLILPLAVVKNGKGYVVVDGNRRLAALNQVFEDKKTQVPVLIQEVDLETAREQSLAANIERLEMHPMDQWEAFARIGEDGRSLESIAAHFGVTQRMVKQRMALGSLCETARQLYREEEIDDDVAQKLTRLDHDAQNKLISSQPHGWKLRAALDEMYRENTLSYNHAIARFVGREEYVKAGGQFVPDLFAEPGQEQWSNVDLAFGLSRAKLRILNEEVLDAGWQFFDFSETWVGNGYTLEDPAGPPTELSPADQVKLNELQGRMKEIEAESGGEEPLSLELEKEFQDIEASIYALVDDKRTWTDEQKSRLGVVVDNRYEVHYGCTRREGTVGRDPEDVHVERKEKDKDAPKPWSTAILDELDGHLTHAVQAALIDDPGLAVCAFLLQLIEQSTLFEKTGYSARTFAANIEVNHGVLPAFAYKLGDAIAAVDALKLGKAKTYEKKLETISWLGQDQVIGLLGYIVARGLVTQRASSDLVGYLAKHKKLSIRMHYTPDAENLFVRLSKQQLLELVKAEGWKLDELSVEKKFEMAARIEKVVPADWVPAHIRPKKVK